MMSFRLQAEVSVRDRSAVPSAFTMQMSAAFPFMPSGMWTNAIREPSGDQRGSTASPRGIDTRRRWFVPSAFIVKISVLPFLQLMNAIDVPSGDHDGYIPLAGSVVSRRRSPPADGPRLRSDRHRVHVAADVERQRRAIGGEHGEPRRAGVRDLRHVRGGGALAGSAAHGGGVGVEASAAIRHEDDPGIRPATTSRIRRARDRRSGGAGWRRWHPSPRCRRCPRRRNRS